MDSNTVLIVVNLLLNLFQVMDHFVNRLKSSKCFGASLEMRETNETPDIENQIKSHKESNDKIIEQLKNLINLKNEDNKNELNKL